MKSNKLIKKILLIAFAVTLPYMEASAVKVGIRSNARNTGVLVCKATGDTIQGTPEDKQKTSHYECEPGIYIFSEPENTKTASVELVIPQIEQTEDEEIYFRMRSVVLSAMANNLYLKYDIDFTIDNLKVLSPEGMDRIFTPNTYMRFNNATKETVNAGFQLLIPEGDYITAEIKPVDPEKYEGGGLIEQTIGVNGYGQTFKFTEIAPSFKFIVPEGASVDVSYKVGTTHYVPFAHVEPRVVTTENNTTIYDYAIDDNTITYGYRIKYKDYITRAGLFKSSDNDISFTAEELAAETPHYFNHNVADNKGLNYADIYLNINKRGLLRMNSGDTFLVRNLRTWQLTNNETANYFIEPEYHYTVLNTSFEPDNSVIEIADNGLITAKGAGTAIVQVRYDALALGSMGGDLWSELWAENTGTFVVTVDADAAAAPADNIRLAYKSDSELDSEHDILYYMASEAGHYHTFTPAEGSTVTVANPVVNTVANTVAYPKGFSADNVTVNSDGSVTVLLTFGRNIIRTADAAGNANYQVLSAKPVTMEVKKDRTDSYVLPGDNISLQFSGLFHISGKLAAVYNSNCHLYIDGFINEEGVLIGSGQYDFASRAASQRYTTTIPLDHSEPAISYADNSLYNEGYGSGPGAHRAIGPEGLDPNFNAGVAKGRFGFIPAQTIAVTKWEDVDTLTMTVDLGERAYPLTDAAFEAFFGKDANWESEDPSIIYQLDGTHALRTMKAGTTCVSVTRANPAMAGAPEKLVCKVTVNPNEDYIPVTGIVYTGETGVPEEYDIITAWGNWGTNYMYKAKVVPENATINTIRYVSDNPEAVGLGAIGQETLETSGSVRLFWSSDNEPGESKIYATTIDGNYSLEVPIIVRFNLASDRINLSDTEVTLTEGSDFQLTYTLSPSSSNDVLEWTSDNPDVATVDENGLITAIAVGNATITAKAVHRFTKATCSVTVTKTTGVENLSSESTWSFGPNPVESVLTVNSNCEGTLSIYNFNGTLATSAAIRAGVNTIDVSALPAGIYLMQMGNRTEKLIKK